MTNKKKQRLAIRRTYWAENKERLNAQQRARRAKNIMAYRLSSVLSYTRHREVRIVQTKRYQAQVKQALDWMGIMAAAAAVTKKGVPSDVKT